ncbi:hypothetical protein NP233_g8219 [Leucocoprinus birnbaumii]|uniref:Uncharacterized protein n=1 Tax=Leucocoprinus birnbaumii TaxID=56174 RepID=A0AAD5VQF7_9AGAR|nr:hypothetical protein NP233_g8219 [Leucocoprinus birnbaumii]
MPPSDAGQEELNPPQLQNPPPVPQPQRIRPRQAFQFAPDDMLNPFQTPQRPGLGPANWNLGAIRNGNHSAMPGRHDRSAPHFDGHPLSLKRFFDEIDYLGDSRGLLPSEKIQHTLRYLDYHEYETWKSRPSAQGLDWEAFKRDITSLYPGADEDRRYTLVDLELLADKQARQPMRSRYQFGEYYRQFVTVSDWLLAHNEISLRERNNIFLSGFDTEFREKLTSRLRLKNPDHPLHQAWRLEDVADAARFFLSSNSAASDPTSHPAPQSFPQPRFESPAPSFAPASRYTTPAPAAAPSTRETFDMSSLEQFMVSDAFLSKLADKLGSARGNNSPRPPMPPSNSSAPRAPRAYGCVGCLDPNHYHQSCPVIADYITRGVCKRNEYNQVVLMDGTLITNRVAPGRCIRERLDNWLQSQNRVSTNIVEAYPASHAEQYSYTIPDPRETLISEVSAAELEELRQLDAVAVATLKRAEDIRKRVGNGVKSKAGPGVTTRSTAKASNAHHSIPSATPTQRPTNPVPAPNPIANPSSTNPQFRFKTPIEDPAIVQRVVEKGMEGTVTLTQRELLAIAPDVRKIVKDQLTTRKVALEGASVSFVEEAQNEDSQAAATLIQSTSPPASDLIVAEHSVELRTLPVTLEGRLEVDAILDEGSQIIGLRRDLWEKLGLPIHSDKVMVMESANKSTNKTMGLLQNLRVSIGDCDFYLQVQVVDNTSYDMLLGRPFLTLAQANTRHFTNGDSHITLVDPNSHSIITVPTRPRIRNAPPGFHNTPSDF